MTLQSWDSLWLLIILISFVAIAWPVVRRNMLLKRWRLALELDKHEAVFNRLYDSVNGFELSKKSRRNNDAIAYTYGEIQFQSFIALISLCRPNEETVFYDLGSGSGKAVMAIAMVFPVKKAVGIECLASLHKIAQYTAKNMTAMQAYQQKTNVIEFVQQDYLECNWMDASLVFINSTTIIGELWDSLVEKLDELRPDSIVITTTKAITSESYQLLYCTDVLMSWGIVTAFIQKRV